MTPQEEARKIVIKIQSQKEPLTFEQAKQCALITIDEIIKETKLHDLTIYQQGRTGYFQEVKQEIINLKQIRL